MPYPVMLREGGASSILDHDNLLDHARSIALAFTGLPACAGNDM